MERIGLRELARHTSKIVARVRDGQTIQVTDHGKPILRLVPESVASGGLLDRLISAGIAQPAAAAGSFGAVPPLGRGEEDGLSLTGTLMRMREEERY